MTQHTHNAREYLVILPVEDFLAITQLVEAACSRNSDVRIKGFYLKLLENLGRAWKDNQE
jgi:hypothetical protein